MNFGKCHTPAHQTCYKRNNAEDYETSKKKTANV